MIEINNLDFSYRKMPVFHDISIRFRPGNIYGLLGENGVGKTTLLKIICGLQQPQQGRCTVDGLDSFDRKPQFLQRIVFMPDEVVLPDNVTPAAYIRELAPFYPTYDESEFLRLMQEMAVSPDRRFKEMSFGQQKKALIACSLSLGTDYVLLDEPTNGLDIPSKADFRRILSQRVQENTTIIISTHQVRDVENLIDPIIILAKDEVLLNAGISEITEKLHFGCDPEKDAGALYSEMVPGGYLNVRPNTEGEETQVNIEALFNAVLKNHEAVQQIFAQKGEAHE